MRHQELSKNGIEHKNYCAHADAFTALKVFIMYYVYNKEIESFLGCWKLNRRNFLPRK